MSVTEALSVSGKILFIKFGWFACVFSYRVGCEIWTGVSFEGVQETVEKWRIWANELPKIWNNKMLGIGFEVGFEGGKEFKEKGDKRRWNEGNYPWLLSGKYKK